MKEREGNERIRNYTKNGVTCWSGNDDEAHDAKWDAGAAGVISVTSNVAPKLMRELMPAEAKPGIERRFDPSHAMVVQRTEPNRREHRTSDAGMRRTSLSLAVRAVR